MAHLISGKPHSLKEIFYGENDKVIIPDLQRDYCWGNPISTDSEESLVDSFIDSIYKLDKSQDITMGLIYGYYNDEKLMSYHLQLCDGQQRLTTLFLLIGVLNRKSGDNRYKDILISNFELTEDDNEPHLMYGIRESSLYFLSDLTIHYFLDASLTIEELEKQPWFLNSYNQDPTVSSMRRALQTIERKLETYEDTNILGDFLIEKLKFLFYDMNNRQNGEETFVVINTTGEPLSANQNLKPLIIMENSDYKRVEKNDDGTEAIRDTANDWEEMETWFWQQRRRNDIDTSTEGMLAFLHCVRILESETEEEWHKNYETKDDKFPLTIKMKNIWKWFCSYKRLYEMDYQRLATEKICYPSSQSHYTQKELYALLPAMEYCANFKDATDEDVERLYHLFYNMSKYRNVYRSSQNELLNVPAFRTCQLVRGLESKDVLALLDTPSFEVEEERVKLTFIKEHNESRNLVEETFAKAESYPIYEGQIATLVSWSNSSVDDLLFYYNKIKNIWVDTPNRNKVRQALLAYEVPGYPMANNTANHTLCSKTEWRELFEKSGDSIKSFLHEGDLDSIIEKYKNEDSPYYPLINDKDAHYLNYSQNHNIRLHPFGVIELMAKKNENGQFLLFHRGEIFAKDIVDKKYWTGFWIWSDEKNAVFHSLSKNYNLTLDMAVRENGYQIIAWTNRRPAKLSISSETLKEIGFVQTDDSWLYTFIESPSEAKKTFVEITQKITELTSK